jgi:hypothetical protein
MHDPQTVAFDIKNPFIRKDSSGYRPNLITIWHNDPCTDGTDDSCGWFIRSRHVEKAILHKVTKAFEFEFQYWFNEAGYPTMSIIGTVLNMYSRAAWTIFMERNNGRPTDKAWRQYQRFMRKYTFDIIKFAENPTDSLNTHVTMKYGVEKKEERVLEFSRIITADIFRKLNPWYKHPRWHIHHWRIQFNFLQNFKRRYWDKCAGCGKRGFKGSAIGNWQGTAIWHPECYDTPKPTKPEQI